MRKVLEEVKTLDRQETHTLLEHRTHSTLRQPLRGQCLPLPPPRTRPEGAEPDGRICRICGSGGSGRNRVQASWPGRQGLEFNSRRNMGRTTKSRSDARDLLLQARLGFSRGCAAQPMRPRTPLHSFLHRSPKTLASKPHKAQTTPRNSQGTGQPPPPGSLEPSLSLPSRPGTALPAFMGSQTQTTRKCFARSLPTPALSLKQKRREEGGGRGGGRKV